MTPDELEAELWHLGASEMDSLGVSLRERARLRRVPLSELEARHEMDGTPPTHHGVPFVGQFEGAARILIEGGWHPEQIVDSMTAIAEQLLHPLLAVEAVACGIADGMETREGDRQ